MTTTFDEAFNNRLSNIIDAVNSVIAAENTKNKFKVNTLIALLNSYFLFLEDIHSNKITLNFEEKKEFQKGFGLTALINGFFTLYTHELGLDVYNLIKFKKYINLFSNEILENSEHKDFKDNYYEAKEYLYIALFWLNKLKNDSMVKA